MREKNDLELKIILILFFITAILFCFAPLNYRGDSGESISVFTPVEGSTYRLGESQVIRWQHPVEEYNVVDIYLYDGNIKVKTIIINYRNRRAYEWQISGIFDESDDYRIKVVDSSDSSIYGYSDYFNIFYEDGFTVLEPSSRSIWNKGTIKEIKWDSRGLVSNVSIYLYEQDSNKMDVVNNIADTESYSWKIPASLENSDTYRIKIEDSSDSSTFDFSDYFEITISNNEDDNIDNGNSDQKDEEESKSSNDNSNSKSIPGINVLILLIIAFISMALIIGISLVGKTICGNSRFSDQFSIVNI